MNHNLLNTENEIEELATDYRIYREAADIAKRLDLDADEACERADHLGDRLFERLKTGGTRTALMTYSVQSVSGEHDSTKHHTDAADAERERRELEKEGDDSYFIIARFWRADGLRDLDDLDLEGLLGND